jgi:MFS family permease
MNEKPGADWNDLAKMWQADAAAVSVDEIDAHLRRQRRQMLWVTAVEVAGAILGVCVAFWLAFFTRYRWVGVGVAVFALVSAVVMVRMRREVAPSGTVDAAQSLKDSIEREDWIAEQLRLGRALSFSVLFAIVMATSSQLLRFHSITSVGLAASIAGSAYVAGVLAWNLVLTRRARRRRARLQYINDRLKS